LLACPIITKNPWTDLVKISIGNPVIKQTEGKNYQAVGIKAAQHLP